jgi:hypothetical protein
MANLESATDQEEQIIQFKQLTWLNSKDAATYLRKSENALRIMAHRGYVRPKKFRRRLYFLRVELDRILESSAY